MGSISLIRSLARFFFGALTALLLTWISSPVAAAQGTGSAPTRNGGAQGTPQTQKTIVQPAPCPRPYVYTVKDSGDMIEGPVCVGVQFNALRYGGQLGRTVTVSAGPALPAGLTPPSAIGASAPQTPVRAPEGRAPDTIGAIEGDYANIRDSFYTRAGANTDAEGIVGKTVTALKNLILGSDDVFNAAGAGAVLMQANDSNLQLLITDALRQQWLTSDDIYTALQKIQGRLQDYSFANPNPNDPVKIQITQLQTNITSTLTDVALMRSGSDRAATFGKQVSLVAAWNALIKSLEDRGQESFRLETYITCGGLFNQNKQIAVRLLLTDRLPSFDSTALTQTDLKDPFVTVTCGSPFVVSAGIEFSFLRTSTFGIVPSGTSGANVFGVTETAKISPLPIGMVHGRLGESSDHKVGLYASFGAAAHVQGSASGGSSAEFLTGLSVGLLRTAFLSVGWHLGKVSELSGGYSVGQAVPTGVTTAPVTSSYKSGVGLAVTFTKP